MDRATFMRALPKAELHVHIEGTLEPEMMFDLGRRNNIPLPFETAQDVRDAYEFTSLQSFLDIYYQGAAVLVTEADFRDLMLAYLERAHQDGVRRAEIFFDPQTHTERGIDFSVFMQGFATAIAEAKKRWNISSGLIMCFLRHLAAEDAVRTWHDSEPYRDQLLGIGLDSSEIGRPPGLFAEVFNLARDAGFHVVAHAGEEGPARFVTESIDTLGAERIDHGVRASDDPSVVDRLARDDIPLTMCPLSNLRLRVFEDLSDHNLGELLEAGVMVTVNSDDPAYFGGYILDNYLALVDALGLSQADVIRLARNSIEAAFLPESEKMDLLGELANVVHSLDSQSPSFEW